MYAARNTYTRTLRMYIHTYVGKIYRTECYVQYLFFIFFSSPPSAECIYVCNVMYVGVRGRGEAGARRFFPKATVEDYHNVMVFLLLLLLPLHQHATLTPGPRLQG